jgi:hypothetical protein
VVPVTKVMPLVASLFSTVALELPSMPKLQPAVLVEDVNFNTLKNVEEAIKAGVPLEELT